jgi:hypothetical protein
VWILCRAVAIDTWAILVVQLLSTLCCFGRAVAIDTGFFSRQRAEKLSLRGFFSRQRTGAGATVGGFLGWGSLVVSVGASSICR